MWFVWRDLLHLYTCPWYYQDSSSQERKVICLEHSLSVSLSSLASGWGGSGATRTSTDRWVRSQAFLSGVSLSSMAMSLSPSLVRLCAVLEVTMRPQIICPGCDEMRPATHHHYLPRRFWGRNSNNYVLPICAACHRDLERYIPQHEQMPKAFYHAIVKVYLEVLCKKAKAQSAHRIFNEPNTPEPKE